MFNPTDIADAVTKRWSKVTVPFFGQDPKSAHRALGLGTGFITCSHGSLFLVTALHVLKGHSEGEAVMGNFNGSGATINDLAFAILEDEDIAVARLTREWAEAHGVAKSGTLPCLSIDDVDNRRERLGIYVLMGFPGSKNRLNKNTGETDRYMVGYSAYELIEQPAAKTHVKTPVAFRFDKKRAVKSNGGRADVGVFNGNSGGPVVEVFGNFGTPFGLSVGLAGIFVGWDKNTKELVCARPEALHDAITLLDSKGF